MPCTVCNETGFIEENCPECEGNPDQIGGTGCSTCGGDGYIELPCKECDVDIYDILDNHYEDNECPECPKCGNDLIFVSVSDGEYSPDRLVATNWLCEDCNLYFKTTSPIDQLSDGIVDEALWGNFCQ